MNSEILEKDKINTKSISIKEKLYFGVKRTFDIIFSLIGLVFLVPVLIIVKISYMLTGDFHSIIFKQERTGRYGKKFNLYKIRSMVAGNNVRDMSCEDKFTKVGRIIRKLSLDELLQVINILKGDMSFIGPRPWIPEYYENMNEKQRHRCDVRPGLSGLAQVKGRNDISIFEKINYDLEYVKTCSVKTDIKIVFMTIKAVFGQKGVDACKSTIHDEIEALKKQNRGTLNEK